jgi:hypothetical protein
MSKGLIILELVLWFILALPFIRIAFKEDNSQEKGATNDGKINILLLLIVFVIPIVLTITFYMFLHS